MMFKEELVFELSGPQLSEAEINQIIPYKFKGKEAFAAFYYRQNGGYFRDGACIFRDNFYEISKGDYNTLEIESFYYIPIPLDEKKYNLRSMFKIWNMMKQKYNDKFTENHLPFASDAGGNDFWINLIDGKIKYTNHEDENYPQNAIITAPSFYDFYTNIRRSLS